LTASGVTALLSVVSTKCKAVVSGNSFVIPFFLNSFADIYDALLDSFFEVQKGVEFLFVFFGHLKPESRRFSNYSLSFLCASVTSTTPHPAEVVAMK
jgi:hypothetical protein